MLTLKVTSVELLINICIKLIHGAVKRNVYHYDEQFSSRHISLQLDRQSPHFYSETRRTSPWTWEEFLHPIQQVKAIKTSCCSTFSIICGSVSAKTKSCWTFVCVPPCHCISLWDLFSIVCQLSYVFFSCSTRSWPDEFVMVSIEMSGAWKYFVPRI